MTSRNRIADRWILWIKLLFQWVFYDVSPDGIQIIFSTHNVFVVIPLPDRFARRATFLVKEPGCVSFKSSYDF